MVLPYQPPFVPPPSGAPPAWRAWAMRIVDAVAAVQAGKQNNTGAVTLSADADSTTIVDARISASSVILFMPLTEDAAAEVAAGALRVSAQTSGQATVTHVNDPSATRQFRYLIIA